LEIVLIALLVIGIIAFIAYPLFDPRRGTFVESASVLDTLIAQRDATYDALRDLDFDFQLGKLSKVDYDTLRDKYKARAAYILQQIDALAGTPPDSNGKDAEAQIEAQVAQLRRAKTEVGARRASPDTIEDEIARVRALRQAGGGFCSKCGTPYRAGDKFCAKCGNKL
jgi:hypothetical protein